MGHEIHFMGNLPRTDLALDLIDENQTMEGFTKKVKQYNHCKVTWVNITNEGSKKISKKAGYYITIEFDDVTDHENEQEVLKVTAEAVKHLLEILSIQKDALVLLLGLEMKILHQML